MQNVTPAELFQTLYTGRFELFAIATGKTVSVHPSASAARKARAGRPLGVRPEARPVSELPKGEPAGPVIVV